MSALEDRVDTEFAPAWRPEPGDKLVGEIVGLGERAGEYGVYPIAVIRQDDGDELAVHAFHHVLQAELASARPRLGERIAIKFVCKVASRSGKGTYASYKVALDRPQVVDWGHAERGGDELLSDVPSDVPAPSAAVDDGDDLPF